MFFRFLKTPGYWHCHNEDIIAHTYMDEIYADLRTTLISNKHTLHPAVVFVNLALLSLASYLCTFIS